MIFAVIMKLLIINDIINELKCGQLCDKLRLIGCYIFLCDMLSTKITLRKLCAYSTLSKLYLYLFDCDLLKMFY